MLTGYTAEGRWPDLFREMRRAQDEIGRRFSRLGGPRLALRTEFPPVRFERAVPWPDGLDVDAAKATVKNGVLTITIPKTAEAQTEVKHIQVKRA